MNPLPCHLENTWHSGVDREGVSKHDAICKALLCSIYPFPITSHPNPANPIQSPWGCSGGWGALW